MSLRIKCQKREIKCLKNFADNELIEKKFSHLFECAQQLLHAI